MRIKALACSFASLLAAAGALTALDRSDATSARTPEKRSSLAPLAMDVPPEVQHCAGCHRPEVERWLASHHHAADRPLSESSDRAAFSTRQEIVRGPERIRPRRENGRFIFHLEAHGQETSVAPDRVIGVAPLRQYLVSAPGGRWQALDLGYDSARAEWFSIFGNEIRQPADWGHWRNRGMTWNAQCAVCHTTAFSKGYDAAGDAYASQWSGAGISCAQCHAGLEGHVVHPEASPPRATAAQVMDNCASCHALREELTGDFKSGDAFADHFRPLLVDAGNHYYPDGQVWEEDFEYGSFRLSRMGNHGVTCLDCHDPHSGRTLLPVETNALCLRCHGSAGSSGAPVIVPARHVFHAAGAPGSHCVDCHMPQTTYMQRHARRDHGFTVPNPFLTKAIGVPNACNRCHADRSTDWALAHAEAWYGPKLDSPARARALLVDRARRQDVTAVPALLALISREENPAWRASLVGLLEPWAGDATVQRTATALINDNDPFVRAAIARVLAAGGKSAAVAPLLTDSARSVRLTAASLLVNSTTLSAATTAEYRHYLDHISDQPLGALRQSDYAAHHGDLAAAETWARRAAAWEQGPVELAQLAAVLAAQGRGEESGQALRQAVANAPTDAAPRYLLALHEAEKGEAAAAERDLLTAVRLDPSHARAWYNLGLLQARRGNLRDAVTSLDRAECLMPSSPAPAFAAATVWVRLGDLTAARAALRRALERDPAFAPALAAQAKIGDDDARTSTGRDR